MTIINAKPEILDLDLYAGDAFTRTLEFVRKDTGAPFPLTGTWTAEIRDSGQLLTSFQIDTSSMATGRLALSLTAEQTRALYGVDAVWDLQQADLGNIRTWLRGLIDTTEDVTR